MLLNGETKTLDVGHPGFSFIERPSDRVVCIIKADAIVRVRVRVVRRHCGLIAVLVEVVCRKKA